MTQDILTQKLDSIFQKAEPLEREWHARRSRTWVDDAAFGLIVWAATTHMNTFWRSAHVVHGGIVFDVPLMMLAAVAVWHMVKHVVFSLHVRKCRPSLLVTAPLMIGLWYGLMAVIPWTK